MTVCLGFERDWLDVFAYPDTALSLSQLRTLIRFTFFLLALLCLKLHSPFFLALVDALRQRIEISSVDTKRVGTANLARSSCDFDVDG